MDKMCEFYYVLGRAAKYCDEHLSACLSVRLHKPHDCNFTKFYPLSVTVARSSSGGVAMLCTSGFVDDVMFS